MGLLRAFRMWLLAELIALAIQSSITRWLWHIQPLFQLFNDIASSAQRMCVGKNTQLELRSKERQTIGLKNLIRPNVRFGSLADCRSANRHVRFVPIADIESWCCPEIWSRNSKR